MSCLTAKIYRNQEIKLKVSISPICARFGFLESEQGDLYVGAQAGSTATLKIFSNSKYIIQK